jgi:hypothetical protein
MTVADLISHLRECDPDARVEADLEHSHYQIDTRPRLWGRARGALVTLTSGNRDGREVVILNAREDPDLF